MMKLKKSKKGMTMPVIAILIISMVALVVLLVVLVPGIKDAVEDLLKILDLDDKDSYIRSFEIEQGLEGALVLKYRFINDKDIWGYELNATLSTGEETKKVTSVTFDDEDKKDHLIDGEEIRYPLAPPSGLYANDYTLYALDNTGKVLQKKTLEWPGMFNEQKNYDTQIRQFRYFADTLENLNQEQIVTLPYHEDLIILGFSKDFNNGEGRYINQIFAGFRGLCGRDDIPVPPECKEQNSCLCLCKREDNGKKLDKEEFCHVGGRICFGYEEYNFIGGTRRSCGWFDDSDGEHGEDNAEITLWKDTKIDEGIFYSLAISKDEKQDKEIIIKAIPKEGMSIMVNKAPIILGGGTPKTVNGLIIIKLDAEQLARVLSCTCIAGPDDGDTGLIEGNRHQYYWNENTGYCFWCSGRGGRDVDADEWGWIKYDRTEKEECLSNMEKNYLITIDGYCEAD